MTLSFWSRFPNNNISKSVINCFLWSEPGPPTLTYYRSLQMIMRFRHSMIHMQYPVKKLGTQGWKCMSWVVSFNSHFACTFAVVTSNSLVHEEIGLQGLCLGRRRKASLSRQAKGKLQNKCHWTHILRSFWWNWRAFFFKTTFVLCCKTVNTGFNFITCTLFTQKVDHMYIKSQVLLFSQAYSFLKNPNSDDDISIT